MTFIYSDSAKELVEKRKYPLKKDFLSARGHPSFCNCTYCQQYHEAVDNYSKSLTRYPYEGTPEMDGKEFEEGKDFRLQIQDMVDGEWLDRIDGDYVNFNANPKTDRRIIAVKIDNGCQCPACIDGVKHTSDCAVHNEPAMKNEDCDCVVAIPIENKSEESKEESAIKKEIRRLMDEEPVKFINYCLLLMAKDMVKGNIGTMDLSQESDVAGNRYKISASCKLEQIKTTQP